METCALVRSATERTLWDVISFRAVSAGHLPTPNDDDFHVDDDLSTPLHTVLYIRHKNLADCRLFLRIYTNYIYRKSGENTSICFIYVYDLYILNMININDAWFY